MGKTKISSGKLDTQITFYAMSGTIKDRNCMKLTEEKMLKEIARIHRTIEKTS